MANNIKSFWDSVVQSFGVKPKTGNTDMAYAQFYPVWEQQTPQYVTPNAFNLAQQGYRLNEVVFSCIRRRASATAEARLSVWRDNPDGTREELITHPAYALLKRPNSAMTQAEFINALMVYMDIAGGSPWEVEYTKGGDPLALWPMRPDWCSYKRGPDKPLAFIRYQPYGLPPVDVPIERVVNFAEFDPIFPMLKPLSRTAVALREIGVDNDTTNILGLFMQNGAFLSGLLTTDQQLNKETAQGLKDSWKASNGGAKNAGNVAVLGSGAKYQALNSTFREMQFSELDARTESRICMVFEVNPILINAKTGMDRMTFNNFAEANRAFHQFTIAPIWKFIAQQLTEQLLPKYGETDPDVVIDWDVSKVQALQEDRTAKWTRAVTAAQSGLITRDEAREEMGLDPIDEVPVFVSAGTPPVGEETETTEVPEQLQPFAGQDNAPDMADDTDEAVQELERKQFSEFARKRVKEGKADDLKSFKWKHTPPWKQTVYLMEAGLPDDAPFRGDENY